jgi:hypothetical protein
MLTQRWSWLIAKTAAFDAEVLDEKLLRTTLAPGEGRSVGIAQGVRS